MLWSWRKQFLRCTNNRRFVTVITAHHVYNLQNYTIRNVSTVPGQQKIHSVDRRERYVQRVRCRLVGECRCSEDAIRESSRFSSNAQYRQISHELEPRARRIRVAATDFKHDELRYVKVEALALTIPPLTRKLLMRQAYDITTWPRSKVADHIAVEVCRGLHAPKLPQVRENDAGPRLVTISGAAALCGSE